jgi:predicted Rossmann fold nucleotide-binding protein DprA/Smf involved in DNA uptake
LAERLGISPAELLSNLVALELLGLVKARAGGYCLVENWT